jgi:large subunit ribosomal protein L18
MITPKYIVKKERKKRMRMAMRKKVKGTTDRPRMIIVKSNKYLYAQVVDDSQGKVLATVSTLEKDLKSKLKSAKGKDAAKLMGEVIAERLKEKNIKTIVFDRNTYSYAGRVKIFADTAREKGIDF